MAALKQIEVEVAAPKDLALIANDESVWLVVPIRWWDLATLAWWLFMPADRRAKVRLVVADGGSSRTTIHFRAVRVATRHVRIRGAG